MELMIYRFNNKFINAATTFAEQHKLKYVMLFDNDIDKFIANILEERDSLEIPKGSR